MPRSKNKGGRPTSYTEAIALEIFDRLSQGESLTSIVKSAHMPTYSTVMYWLTPPTDSTTPSKRRIYEQFSEIYTRARQAQAAYFADEILEIADETDADFESDDEGKLNHRKDHIMRTRLRVDTRKWLACKYYPRFFGDQKQTSVELTDSSGSGWKVVISDKVDEDA